jgi:hypothetical protein
VAGLLVSPIRRGLYTISDNLYWLVNVQLLDGIGAGIYGVIFPIIAATMHAAIRLVRRFLFCKASFWPINGSITALAR